MELARTLLLLGALGIIIAFMLWLGLGLTGLGRGLPSFLNCGCCCTSVIFIVIGVALWITNRR